MAIELSKTYRTRDGRPVRVYALDGSGDFPIHGAIRFNAGWHTADWQASGLFSREEINRYDLIEVRPMRKVKGWLNVYQYSQGILHATRKEADHAGGGDSHNVQQNPQNPRIACIEIDVETEDLSRP